MHGCRSTTKELKKHANKNVSLSETAFSSGVSSRVGFLLRDEIFEVQHDPVVQSAFALGDGIVLICQFLLQLQKFLELLPELKQRFS